MTVDLLIVNSIGPGWTLSTAQKGLGGSELEISLVAHALVRRGYSVVVANGVPSQAYEQGVRYVPLASVTPGIEARALWIERMTPPPMGGEDEAHHRPSTGRVLCPLRYSQADA